MIAYIKGKLTKKREDYIIVENNDIGYKIFCLQPMQERIGALGEDVCVHTYHYVREDTAALFGFSEPEEHDLFILLLQVSGIGPKVAIALAAQLSPSAFSLAVLSGDVKKLTQIKGVGKKGAERIILELKDKLKGFAPATHIDFDDVYTGDMSADTEPAMQEAINAMVVLGYSPTQAMTAVSKKFAPGLSAEELIRLALREMG